MLTVASSSLIVVVAALLFVLVWRRGRWRAPAGCVRPPKAPGAVPILGHALRYKDDPAGFICSACAKVGPIFRLNLAGKRMLVVGPSATVTKTVATAPTSKLSARQAVADVGFNETLGARNVFTGTSIHKSWIKDAFAAGRLETEVPALWDALGRSLAHEAMRVRRGSTIDDLFGLVRSTVLRAQLERLLGSPILRAAGDNTFIDAFMSFQDAIEDATAKAAVLPRILSLPLVLWPVARRRRELTARLARAMQAAEPLYSAISDATVGSWYRFVRGIGEVEVPHRSHAEVAELAIGLLFASHKNPSIGAAQTVCHLLSELADDDPTLEAVRAEAKGMAAQPSAAHLASCHAIRRSVLETLRVCAHAIGAVRTVVAPTGFELGSGLWAAPGETIALAHIATHRSVAVWGHNAADFVPHRDAYGARPSAPPTPPDEYTYTTFSHGLHQCPGEQLALRTCECVVAQLIALGLVLPRRPLPRVSFERATLAQRDARVEALLDIDLAALGIDD